MTTRLRNRIEAVAAKAGIGAADASSALFFVKGYGEDAKVFLRSQGHVIGDRDRIVRFIPAADGKPVVTPLVDLTAKYGRAA